MKNKKTKSTVFESMAQCSAQMHIPITALREAKRLGCSAFKHHGRIYLEEFLRWWFVTKPKAVDTEAIRARKLEAETQLREMQARENDNDWFRKVEVEKSVSEWVVIPLRNLLDGLPSTLCSQVNPENPALARRAIEEWVEGTAKPILRSKLPNKK